VCVCVCVCVCLYTYLKHIKRECVKKMSGNTQKKAQKEIKTESCLFFDR
jgi:hypothetical protein